MLKPGDRIDPYLVEAAIGGGGMARVWRVRHLLLDMPMALKVLEPDWVAREGVRRRFLAEGRIMARVRHPSIVMVTDAVMDPSRGLAGLVLELVEGPDLARVIARMKGPPGVDFVRQVMLPVLDGVHHVHTEGVVHRDLKPANVLLSRDAGGHWHPRVTDFGVAWVDPGARLSRVAPPRSRGLAGTPAYMAPEQAAGHEPPDPRWDVWALGMVLYELATGGHHPLARDDDAATLEAVRAGHLPPLERVHPGADPSLVEAVRGALEPDPDRRVPSADALATLLKGRPPPRPVPVVEAPEPLHPGTDVEDAPAAHLELTGLPGPPARFPLAEAVRVGADPGCQVHLPLPGVEDVHCAIVHAEGRWVLTDRSRTGTRVNGARMDRVQLADGDLVRVGSAVLRFRLGEGSDGPAAPSPTPPGPHLAWTVGDRVQRLALGLDPVVVGRSPAADVVLDDPAASLRHARVSVQGRDVLIEDLHSQNGTWVNGQRARFRRLVPGDRITVGGTVFTLRG